MQVLKNLAEEGDESVTYTDLKDLAKVRNALIGAGLTVASARLQYVQVSQIAIDDAEVAQKGSKSP